MMKELAVKSYISETSASRVLNGRFGINQIGACFSVPYLERLVYMYARFVP